MFKRIKEAIFGEGREDTLDFMPKPRHEDWRPKAKIRREVTKDGQIRVPAEKRTESRFGTTIDAGEKYLVHVFAADYTHTRSPRSMERFKAEVTKNHYITIPKEIREKLDVQPGDTIAIHMYWSAENFND